MVRVFNRSVLWICVFLVLLIAGPVSLGWAQADSGSQVEPPETSESDRRGSSVAEALSRARSVVQRAMHNGRAELSLRSRGTPDPDRAVGPLVQHRRKTPFQQEKGELRRPIPKVTPSYDYGRRQLEDSVSYVRHTGLTWKAESGTDVRAVAEGTVAWVGPIDGYGPVVILDHGDGYVSLYAHLGSTDVKAGHTVEAGTRLGTVGQEESLEGPKLYFELRRGEQPIDPEPWLRPLDSESGSAEPDAG